SSLDHAAAARAAQHYVIQSQAGEHDLAVADHPAFEQRTFFGLELAVEDAGDRFQRVVQRDVGDEAQPAVVDAHHGDVVESQLPGRAQHGAIAAHHDGQVGLRADFGVIGYHELGYARVAGGVGFHQDAPAHALDRRGQLAQGRIKAAVLIA